MVMPCMSMNSMTPSTNFDCFACLTARCLSMDAIFEKPSLENKNVFHAQFDGLLKIDHFRAVNMSQNIHALHTL